MKNLRAGLYFSFVVVTLLSSCTTVKSFNYPHGDEFTGPASGVLQAALFDSMAPVYPDTDVLSGVDFFSTDMALGTAETIVVLIRVPDTDAVIDISVDVNQDKAIQFFELTDVPVYKNTGFYGMTEEKIGFDHHNFVRHAPFSIYEVMTPKQTGEFTGKDIYAFFLKYRADADDDSGRIKVDIAISFGSQRKTLTWDIQVFDVQAPVGDSAELYNTHWFNGPHDGFEERFDEDWWRLLDEQMAFRREGGQNVSWVRDYLMFDSVDGRQVLNEERLDRYIALGEKHGILLYEGYMMAKRISGFRSRDLGVGPERFPTGTEEASLYIQETWGEVYRYLVSRGLTDRWVQHILDEPQSKQAGDYQWIAVEMNLAMPGVRIIEATKTRNGLVGAVDIWSPLVSDYQKNQRFFEKRQEAGDEIWIYTCMVPGGAWVNRLMDQERLRNVYVGWGAAKYDVTGYLRWGFDQWRRQQDLWEGELSTTWQGRIELPQGDEFVVFPGTDGSLLSTTRWESHRQGMEDYRLLQMLKDRNYGRFEDVVAMCFKDFQTYDTDPAVYRMAKRALLKALDDL